MIVVVWRADFCAFFFVYMRIVRLSFVRARAPTECGLIRPFFVRFSQCCTLAIERNDVSNETAVAIGRVRCGDGEGEDDDDVERRR